MFVSYATKLQRKRDTKNNKVTLNFDDIDDFNVFN